MGAHAAPFPEVTLKWSKPRGADRQDNSPHTSGAGTQASHSLEEDKVCAGALGKPALPRPASWPSWGSRGHLLLRQPEGTASKQGKLSLTGHPGPRAQNPALPRLGPRARVVRTPVKNKDLRGEQAPGDLRCPPCFLGWGQVLRAHGSTGRARPLVPGRRGEFPVTCAL